MGGVIEVESTLGEGTEFRVTLPTGPAAQTEASPETHWVPFTGSPLVLLVEDREMVRQVLTEVLKRVGCRVLVAEDGQKGLEIAMANLDSLDVVVTDVVMPERGGVRLIEELRVQKPELKHLYISGYTAGEFKGRGLEPSNFLAKPFNTTELVEKLRVLLESNRGAEV
jgi:DNA-binding response OmpR family regulator